MEQFKSSVPRPENRLENAKDSPINRQGKKAGTEKKPCQSRLFPLIREKAVRDFRVFSASGGT
jgi:hypothetical protein